VVEEYLKRYRILHDIALAFALASVPLAGILLRAQQVKSPAPIPITPPEQGYPNLWKSETTGKEYRVQVDKAHFSAEWVNIPSEGVKRGAYIRSECRRVGSKWIGTTRINLPCTVGEGAKEHVANTCRMQFRIEINSIQADRIVGRGETLKRFDCKSCRIDETGWGDFVWLPKKPGTR
jgi:hypothetical protein